MDELLKFALDAHGGLARWTELTEVEADLSATGALFQVKNQADTLKHIRIEADLRQQRTTTHIIGQNKRLHFTPDSVCVNTEDGNLLGRRDQPRATFSAQQLQTPWDDLHVAYFSGHALWTYFTIPFLYTYPGFVTEELPPWEENGETWRPLSVLFPEKIASHTQKQISYFGPDGLLRRHEYTVDVLGGAKGVNYASEYRNVNGISAPMKRRAYAHDAVKRKLPEPVLVAIDVQSFCITGLIEDVASAEPESWSFIHWARRKAAPPSSRPALKISRRLVKPLLFDPNCPCCLAHILISVSHCLFRKNISGSVATIYALGVLRLN